MKNLQINLWLKFNDKSYWIMANFMAMAFSNYLTEENAILGSKEIKSNISQYNLIKLIIFNKIII